MKNTLILLVAFLVIRCNQPIDTPQALIEASLKATSPEKGWESFQNQSTIKETQILMGGKEVAIEREIGSLALPGLEKRVLYMHDKLTSINFTSSKM